MIKRALLAVLFSASLFVAQGTAGVLIFIDDLSTTGIDVIVEDGLGAGVVSSYAGLLTTHADINAAVGETSFIGAVSANVTSATVTGFGDPSIGPYAIDTLNASVTASSGTYRVATAQTGFTGLPLGNYSVTNEIGGTSTAGASIVTMYGANPANTMFAGPGANVGPVTGSPFSAFGSFVVPGLGGGPFSISQWATVTHTTSGLTSFDMITQVVPEPGSVAIWSVLLGGAFIGARRRRRTK